jgi:hypothetical protein
MADTMGIYNSALTNWLASQNASKQKFAEAESPLTQLASEFAPGGSMQTGQNKIIEQQGAKAGAQGMYNLNATGMSSGSLAAGLSARINTDVATGKVGVEQNRVSNLSDVLKNLSGLRSTAAQQLGNAADPFANTAISGATQMNIAAGNRAQDNVNSLRTAEANAAALQQRDREFLGESSLKNTEMQNALTMAGQKLSSEEGIASANRKTQMDIANLRYGDSDTALPEPSNPFDPSNYDQYLATPMDYENSYNPEDNLDFALPSESSNWDTSLW